MTRNDAMNVLSWMGRGALALLGLLIAAEIGAVIYRTWNEALAVSPIQATFLIWDAWILSWIIATVWSRPAAARPAVVDQAIHWMPTVVGFLLLSYGSLVQVHGSFHWMTDTRLWSLPNAAAWILTGVCAVALLFTWWARIWLGSLWSGSVNRKEAHVLVQSGPYRWVRHPIYTGLIVAAFAMAVQIGMLNNLLGAALMAFGFWLKARLEERFLSAELGSEEYAAFRRRTPMLVPFWPQ